MRKKLICGVLGVMFSMSLIACKSNEPRDEASIFKSLGEVDTMGCILFLLSWDLA